MTRRARNRFRGTCLVLAALPTSLAHTAVAAPPRQNWRLPRFICRAKKQTTDRPASQARLSDSSPWTPPQEPTDKRPRPSRHARMAQIGTLVMFAGIVLTLLPNVSTRKQTVPQQIVHELGVWKQRLGVASLVGGTALAAYGFAKLPSKQPKDPN